MCVRMTQDVLGGRSFSGVLAVGHSRLIGRQFLPDFRIGIIIALCHISGICPVEIDRLKMLVRELMAP